jgi:rhamnosyltransferase subunit B
MTESQRRLHIVLAPIGTEGDVRPYLWLACKLAAAGHQISVAANPAYASDVAEAGFRFLPAGGELAQKELFSNPDLWNGIKGSKLLLDALIQQLDIHAKPFLDPGFHADLIIGAGLAIAATTVAEAKDIPFVRVHLQPAIMRSNIRPPLPAANLKWLQHMPACAARAYFGLADLFLNGKPLRRVNAFRRKLGLSDWTSFYRDAVCAGVAACGLFPDWFAKPQQDWPTSFRCFDFPIDDQKTKEPLSNSIQRFLSGRQAPVLWTHGSANWHTEDFACCVKECTRELGINSILVARSDESNPSEPSPSLLRLAYAPFASLLPQCRAIVHHGGIGTLAAALKAGIPQLILPRAHDQFDNAQRAEQLGFGISLDYERLSQTKQKLKNLLSNNDYGVNAKSFGGRIGDSPDLVPWIESSIDTRRFSASVVNSGTR